MCVDSPSNTSALNQDLLQIRAYPPPVSDREDDHLVQNPYTLESEDRIFMKMTNIVVFFSLSLPQDDWGLETFSGR